MSIYKKILELQKSISYVQKDSTNSHFKYKYVSESALVDKVMKEINEAGLVVLPSLTTLLVEDVCGKPSATVVYKFEVRDTETNEVIEFNAGGFEQGDKCAFKAMTGANKYFFLRFLQIATGDDPEKEEAPTTERKPVQVKQEKESNEGTTPGAAGWANMINKLKTKHKIPGPVITAAVGEQITDAVKNGNVTALEKAWLQLSNQYEQKAG